jgi:hypothetical protein
MAKLLRLITEAMPILHEDKFFLLQIGGDHFLAPNQRVKSRQAKKKFFGEQVLNLNARTGRGVANEGEIKLIFFQRSQELLRRILVKHQFNCGIFFSKRTNDVRQKIRGDGRKRPEKDLSSDLSAHLSNFLMHLPGSFQDTHRMRQEKRPGRREKRFALRPLKESFADLLL